MKTLNYDLVRVAQINSAKNKEINERNQRAKEYLARNKNENASDFMLFLSALSIPMSLMAIYFVGCLF